MLGRWRTAGVMVTSTRMESGGNERYAEADSGGGGDPEQRREPVMTVVLTP